MKVVLIFILLVIICGCREDIFEYTEDLPSGKIIVKSIPSGADIFLNSSRTGKMTPDSLVSLQPALYSVKLKLAGYKDTTITVNVIPGSKKNITINFYYN